MSLVKSVSLGGGTGRTLRDLGPEQIAFLDETFLKVSDLPQTLLEELQMVWDAGVAFPSLDETEARMAMLFLIEEAAS